MKRAGHINCFFDIRKGTGGVKGSLDFSEKPHEVLIFDLEFL